MTTEHPTLRITGTFYPYGAGDPTRPQSVSLYAELDTVEQAQGFAAMFPKGAKVQATTCTGLRNGVNTTWGLVRSHATLEANGSNGGVNESGLRRYRTWLKAAEKLGLTVEWSTCGFGNAYQTQADFEHHVGL